MVNLKQWGHGPRLQHEGDGKPTRSVHLSVTAKIATDARPGGPATKHQPSPEESVWELENRPQIGPRPAGPVAKHQPSPGGLGDGSPRLWSAGGAALPTFGVPHLRRSDDVGLMSQPSRAGLMFGYRPYGPWSDSRSIFEFHTDSLEAAEGRLRPNRPAPWPCQDAGLGV